MNRLKRVSAAELARRSGYSRSSITRLTADGILQRGADKRFDLIDSLERIRKHESTRQQDGKHTIDPELLELRQRYMRVRIERLQWEIDVAKEKYVLSEDVEHATEAMVAQAKGVLLRIPPALGAQLGIEAQKIGQAIVEDALRVLSDDPLGEKHNVTRSRGIHGRKS
ncbi:MAG TPA: hypothetical protein VL171_18815 [Verrucomicrobiae bacterium]|nr:hypothetical protein [Verrucomicrobiae bacterium]